MARKKSIDSNNLLDAAEAVLLHDGIRHFTLDNVASQAGVSKGGLTYNFPSKEQLMQAILDRELRRFQRQTATRGEAFLPDPQARLLGHIVTTRDELQHMTTRAISLLTTLSHAPEMMVSAQKIYRGMVDNIGDATPTERRARLAFFATEGVFLLQGMGILLMSSEERQEVLNDAKALYLLAEPFSSGQENVLAPLQTDLKKPTSPTIKKQSKSLVRIDKIITSAMQIIAREGIAALTHRTIAQEAGVPLGSTTYYFSSLDDLLNAVMTRAIQEFRIEMQSWLSQHSHEEPGEMLTRFVVNKLSDMQALSREYEIFTAAISRPSMRPQALVWSNTVVELLKTVVPEKAALPLGTIINGFFIRGLLEGEHHALDYHQIHQALSALLSSPSL